jgi:hypothetical protein
MKFDIKTDLLKDYPGEPYMKKYIFIFVSALSVCSCATLPHFIQNQDGETVTCENGKKIIQKPPEAFYYKSAVFHDSLHADKQKTFALNPESQWIHINRATASKHSSCRMPRVIDVVGFILDFLSDLPTIDEKKTHDQKQTHETVYPSRRSFSGRRSGR